MSKRRVAVLVAGTLLFVAGMLAGPARAAAPDAQAWWWRANAGAVPPPAPPWVPADGLYVAGNVADREAVSGLRFALPAGSIASTLALEIAGDARGTPVVALCPATSAWTAEQGGAWDKQPQADCAKQSPGRFSADGKTVTFSVGDLVRATELNVLIVPGNTSTFQLAFAKPGPAALQVTRASTSTPPARTEAGQPAGGTAESAASPPGASSAPAALPGASSAPAALPGPALVDVANEATLEPLVPDPATGVSSGTPFVPARIDVGDAAQELRRWEPRTVVVAVLVILNCFALLLWASRRSEPVRMLVRWVTDGSIHDEQEEDVVVFGGVGAFARPRRGRAPRV